jgi:hypothetical protein
VLTTVAVDLPADRTLGTRDSAASSRGGRVARCWRHPDGRAQRNDFGGRRRRARPPVADVDAAEARWRAAQRRERRRRRVLPALGIVGLIALGGSSSRSSTSSLHRASPWAVVQTLWLKRSVLLGNLLPTATEALCGFLIGNAAALGWPRCSCTTGACRRSSFRSS